MSEPLVSVEREAGVALVRLRREEKRNALSMSLRDELESALGGVDSDPALKVAILTGGDRVFSAGFDLEEVIATDFAAFGHRDREFLEAVFGFSKPLITAVAGAAMAGGFDLALAGDIVLAADNAVFGHPEINFGAPPSIVPLVPRVGLARAVEIAMFGEKIDAAAALQMGLVNRVVPVGQLVPLARELAGKLSSKPNAALRAVKRVAKEAFSLPRGEALAFELAVTQESLRDPAHREILRRYFESLRGR